MQEIPLARVWQLPDGTECLLFKNATADKWELRVVRGDETLRAEQFGNPIAAMDEGKDWRAAFTLNV
ncbi:MAG TPA: hypothetical protein VGY57_11000 [Vicinamibacterales bacterium]|jgi:hypothetical protein|nr:hypothetical protein [Vicinamibacterales bacterium]